MSTSVALILPFVLHCTFPPLHSITNCASKMLIIANAGTWVDMHLIGLYSQLVLTSWCHCGSPVRDLLFYVLLANIQVNRLHALCFAYFWATKNVVLRTLRSLQELKYWSNLPTFRITTLTTVQYASSFSCLLSAGSFHFCPYIGLHGSIAFCWFKVWGGACSICI